MPTLLVANIRGPQGASGVAAWPLEIQEIDTPVGNPPAGYMYLYAKADHHLYTKDATGLEIDYSITRYG